jgi:hypothetical protein
MVTRKLSAHSYSLMPPLRLATFYGRRAVIVSVQRRIELREVEATVEVLDAVEEAQSKQWKQWWKHGCTEPLQQKDSQDLAIGNPSRASY